MDTLILAAAGASRRMKNETSKIFMEIEGVPMLVRALAPARQIPSIGRIIVAVRLEDEDRCRRMLRRWKWGAAQVVPGGGSRAQSVWNALQCVPSDDDTVLIHDAARPYASESLWRAVMRAARVHGAAVPAIPVVDSWNPRRPAKNCTESRRPRPLPQTFSSTLTKQPARTCSHPRTMHPWWSGPATPWLLYPGKTGI